MSVMLLQIDGILLGSSASPHNSGRIRIGMSIGRRSNCAPHSTDAGRSNWPSRVCARACGCFPPRPRRSAAL